MEKIITRDVYSKEGSLLVAKGSRIIVSEENKDKLYKLGILNCIADSEECIENIPNNPPSPVNSDALKRQLEIKTLTKILPPSISLSIFQDKTFLKVHDTAENILYNKRDMIWYSHLNTLMNYVSWIYAHSVNTALLSGIIGIKFGYTNEQLYQLVLGALLHDIGMILIPKNILLKPEKLTDVELSFIHNHCDLGCAMIEGADLSDVVKNIISQHHERLDGSGYPHNYNISNLPTEAKIVMIADSFDTATSYRPYKTPKEPNVILNEMLMDSDKYDSKLVLILKNYLFNEVA